MHQVAMIFFFLCKLRQNRKTVTKHVPICTKNHDASLPPESKLDIEIQWLPCLQEAFYKLDYKPPN